MLGQSSKGFALAVMRMKEIESLEVGKNKESD